MPIPESKRRNNDIYNAKCDRISARPVKPVGNAIRAAAKAAYDHKIGGPDHKNRRKTNATPTGCDQQPAGVLFMPFANCFPTGHSFPPETVFAHAISLTEKHRKLKQLDPWPPGRRPHQKPGEKAAPASPRFFRRLICTRA